MHVNPLKEDALTISTINPGDQIISWEPNRADSVRYLTILGDPYVDDDGDLVVEAQHQDGHQTLELTSSVGLSGDRYTGKWHAIAIRDEEPV